MEQEQMAGRLRELAEQMIATLEPLLSDPLAPFALSVAAASLIRQRGLGLEALRSAMVMGWDHFRLKE